MLGRVAGAGKAAEPRSLLTQTLRNGFQNAVVRSERALMPKSCLALQWMPSAEKYTYTLPAPTSTPKDLKRRAGLVSCKSSQMVSPPGTTSLVPGTKASAIQGRVQLIPSFEYA